jgi:isopentenyl phosphate kinase
VKKVHKKHEHAGSSSRGILKPDPILKAIGLKSGDVVLDMEQTFSICGGDALVQRFSRVFRVQRALFVSDIDGIKMKPDGHIASEFTARDLENILPARKRAARGKKKEADDVTGGIVKKAELALAIARGGTDVVVINGKKKGRLLDALKGGKPPGTWFPRC